MVVSGFEKKGNMMMMPPQAQSLANLGYDNDNDNDDDGAVAPTWQEVVHVHGHGHGKPPPPTTTTTTTTTTSAEYVELSSDSSASKLKEPRARRRSSSGSGSELPRKPLLLDSVKKQKRMLSNRESARRSRMRKQQYLDEVRAQVAQLRAENDHMMQSYNEALKRFTQLNEQNQVLHSHATELKHRLQYLHQILISLDLGQQLHSSPFNPFSDTQTFTPFSDNQTSLPTMMF